MHKRSAYEDVLRSISRAPDLSRSLLQWSKDTKGKSNDP